jgi:hypothetical protein
MFDQSNAVESRSWRGCKIVSGKKPEQTPAMGNIETDPTGGAVPIQVLPDIAKRAEETGF